jgi:hypothetical protein
MDAVGRIFKVHAAPVGDAVGHRTASPDLVQNFSDLPHGFLPPSMVA